MVIGNICYGRPCIQNSVNSTFSREPCDIGAATSSLIDDKDWHHASFFLEKQRSPWLPMHFSSWAGSDGDMHGPLCVSAASVCQSFSACRVDASAVSQWPLDSSGWNLCESGENLSHDGFSEVLVTDAILPPLTFPCGCRCWPLWHEGWWALWLQVCEVDDKKQGNIHWLLRGCVVASLSRSFCVCFEWQF